MKTGIWSLLLVLVSCAPLSPSGPKTLSLTILHTNDIHGNAWEFLTTTKERTGGFAAQAALVAKIREEVKQAGGETLVLSGGDINTGVPESDFLDAEPDFLGMNTIGYDAAAIGNHEFDRGLAVLQKQMSWAKFPLLSANIRLKGEPSTVGRPYIVLERQGVKIGVLGLTTDHLKSISLPKNMEPIEVDDAAEATASFLPKMKRDGAELLLAVTHLGVHSLSLPTHRSCPSDDKRIAENFPEFAVIVGGHSHTNLAEGLKVGNTLIVQAGYRGQNLGRVDLVWDREAKNVVSSKATLIPVRPAEGEDAALKEKLLALKAKTEGRFKAVIARAENDLNGERKGTLTELTLGNLLCDALKELNGVEFAFYNSGGIRTSIPAGPITLRHVYMALPFRNTVVTGKLKGSDIIVALNEGLARGAFAGGVIQVSGLSYRSKGGIVEKAWSAAGPIVPEREYNIVANSFMTDGGDGLTAFKKMTAVKDQGVTIDDQFIQYLKGKKVVKGKIQGRITSAD